MSCLVELDELVELDDLDDLVELVKPYLEETSVWSSLWV
jgi:hypothetical protein